ncbi:ATP-binding protein, partial [Clostridium sp.]
FRDGKSQPVALFITKRIIDLMHGTIEVSSQVDEGSCFTVILPLEKA